MTTEATQADGGEITLQAQDMIRLRDSEVTATVGGGRETVGGNITIDPMFVILEDSQILANAFEGRGGNIQIRAEVILSDPDSVVSAIALAPQVGIDGVVDIQTPVADLSGLVTPLPPTFALAATLLRDPCSARLHEGNVSSLVVRGRDSLPVTAAGLLPSRLYAPQQHWASPAGAPYPPQELMAFPLGGDRREPLGRFQLIPEVAPALAALGQGHPCGSP